MMFTDDRHDDGDSPNTLPTHDDDTAGLGGPMRVYKFGITAPTDGADVIEGQFRAAHAYANKLIEIERVRRDAVRAAEGEFGLAPLLVARCAADAEVDRLYDTVKALRGASRKRSAVPAPIAAELAAAKAVRKDAVAAFSQKRRDLKETPAFVARTAAIDAAAKAAITAAREVCNVFWGTYQLVEQAHGQRCAVPLWTLRGEPNNPRFVRADDAARFVSVQIQKKPSKAAGAAGGKVMLAATLGDIMGGNDTRVQIGRPDPRAFAPGPHGVRRAHNKWIPFALRVESDDKGSAVWGRWRMTMHRHIPENSIVRRVSVTCERYGRRKRWFALLHIEHTPGYRRESCGEGGTVALHLGWRQKPDGGLRVGYWTASDGEHGEIALSAAQVSGLRKPAELDSVRRKNFDAALPAFAAYRANGGRVPGDPVVGNGDEVVMPEWLLAQTETVARWKSVDRFYRVVERWLPQYQRFTPEGELNRAPERLYQTEETHNWRPPAAGSPWTVRDFAIWARKDAHLGDWSADQRRKSIARRTDGYRCVVAQLTRRYARLLVDNTDYSDIARLPGVEDDGENLTARSNRQLANASRLRELARIGMAARGGTVVEVDASGGTQTCPHCGCIDKHLDSAAAIIVVCEACGKERDQDEAFGRIALMRDASGLAKVVSHGVPTSGGGGRFAKARAKKAAAARAATEGDAAGA